eukprot:gene291-303_t
MAVMMSHCMLDLGSYANNNADTIEEVELEHYIYESIPHLLPLTRLHPSMLPYYAHTAVRRFMFFLDPYRTRKVKIKKLVQSEMMRDFLVMKMDDECPCSWFSHEFLVQLYQQYLSLDSEKKGMLSPHDLQGFLDVNKQKIQLTPATISRIFEEYVCYQPLEIDYKSFLDLILALENPKTPQSMQYLFRLLDLDKSGYISPMAMTYFYNDISEMLRSNGYCAPPIEHLKLEIFDMAGVPYNDLGITLDEL